MQAKKRDKFVAIIKDIIDKLKKVFANINNLSEIERLENEFLKVAYKVSKMNAKENAQQKTTTEDGSGVKYSLVEEKYTEYNKPITLDDIKILRSIGRKSINDFTQEDIEKSQKWAYKFYQQLGTKSPFFRRWFGDWRAYDKKKTKYISNISLLSIKNVEQAKEYFDKGLKDKLLFRGDVKNLDTSYILNVGTQVYNDTFTYANRDLLRNKNTDSYQARLSILSNIQTIVENSVLLDTEIAFKDNSKNQNMYQSFFHKFYTLVKLQGEYYLVKLTVDELNSESTIRRAYNVNDIKISPVAVSQVYEPADTTDDIGDLFSTISISNLFEIVKQYDKDFKPHPVNEAFLNEDGTPKEFYHGSKKGGGFTKFKDWQYFTENQAYAKRYTERDNEKSLYRVFIKINKPFDTRNPECKKIFEQMKMEYGLSNLQEKGLPDWTDGYDIAEFIEENQLDFDGIILDEGGDLIDGEHISRGLSYVVRNSKQIKSASDNIGTFDTNTDIRYSLPENPTPEQIGEAFKNGEIDIEEYKRLINEAFQQAVKNNGAIKRSKKAMPITALPIYFSPLQYFFLPLFLELILSQLEYFLPILLLL